MKNRTEAKSSYFYPLMQKGLRRSLLLLRQAIRGEEHEFTSGSIDRAIFLLSIPMVLEMLMEGLFALVDIFFAARLGQEAVATIGLTEVVMAQVIGLALGVSMAATAMVARRIGEKDREEANKAAMQVIFIGLILCAALGIAFFAIAGDLLVFMGGSPELVATGTGYAQILLSGSSTVFFLFLLNAIFRGAGDAAIAMRTLWLANGINIVLDPVLMFGWGPFPAMGVTGAAVATTTGRGIGVLYQVWHLVNGRSMIRLERRHIVWIGETILKLVRVSSTGVLQFFVATLSWLIIVRIIADFGDAAVAGYSIGIRIIIFTILPAWGMAGAASTLVGQNLGAGQPDRAEQSVWRTGFFNMIFLTSVSIIFFTTAPDLIGLFTQEPEIALHGILSLRIICLGYVFYAYGMVIGQAFNGAGDTITPSLINLFAFWILQIPLACLFARILDWGPEGVYWAISISESTLAIIAIYMFRKGRWKATKM